MSTEMNQTVYAVLNYLKDQIGNHIHTNGAIPLVNGTQTAATSDWKGATSDISSLADGCAIRYWLPQESTLNNVFLGLTLADGTTVSTLPVFIDVGHQLKNEYKAGSLITLIYRSSPVTEGWYVESDALQDTIENTQIDALF